ncbi:MAG: hypothetical protein ACJARL_002696 [Halopseudomonas sp.]|jgi:hypothetical protein
MWSAPYTPEEVYYSGSETLSAALSVCFSLSSKTADQGGVPPP